MPVNEMRRKHSCIAVLVPGVGNLWVAGGYFGGIFTREISRVIFSYYTRTHLINFLMRMYVTGRDRFRLKVFTSKLSV